MAEATVAPLRYKPKEAAAVLMVDLRTVYRYVREGELSGMWPAGKGPGKKLYLRAGEVAAYAGRWPKCLEGGAEAARRWRRANRVPEPKK